MDFVGGDGEINGHTFLSSNRDLLEASEIFGNDWVIFHIYIKKMYEIYLPLFGGSALSSLLAPHLRKMSDLGNAWYTESRLGRSLPEVFIFPQNALL